LSREANKNTHRFQTEIYHLETTRKVKILELVQIEKYVPVSASQQWLGRPIKEREALARAFVAKSAKKGGQVLNCNISA